MEDKTHFKNDWLDSLNFCLYISKAIDNLELYSELQILSTKYHSFNLEIEDWERLEEIEKELKH